MEDYAEIVLNTHIGVAILAVVTGTVSVVARKSQYTHRTFGKMYVLSIIGTALTAFILMAFPDYGNSIMVHIGLFNLYFAISGYRSLKLKTVFTMDRVSWIDKGISIAMFFVGCSMFYYGMYNAMQGDVWGYILVVYSVFSFINIYKDFRLFNTRQFGAFSWMEFHATKMIGSYVGAVTATLVTQTYDQLGMITWFAPSALGIAYMMYWIKKIRTSPESVFDW